MFVAPNPCRPRQVQRSKRNYTRPATPEAVADRAATLEAHISGQRFDTFATGKDQTDVPKLGHEEFTVITAGVVLLLIGLLTGIAILWSVGVILVVAGAALWILGAAGREIGGRRHYY